MARRFVRSWFSNELEEVNDDSPGGRQIIAKEDASHLVHKDSRHSSAYHTPWVSEALAIPNSQVDEFNETSRRHGTGARYVPDSRTGFARLECDSRRSRAKEMKLRGVFDKSGGYSDYTGSF